MWVFAGIQFLPWFEGIRNNSCIPFIQLSQPGQPLVFVLSCHHTQLQPVPESSCGYRKILKYYKACKHSNGVKKSVVTKIILISILNRLKCCDPLPLTF